jgi:hypothetical protein
MCLWRTTQPLAFKVMEVLIESTSNMIIKVTYCFKIVISEKIIPIYNVNHCLRSGIFVHMFSGSDLCSGGAKFDSWVEHM